MRSRGGSAASPTRSVSRIWSAPEQMPYDNVTDKHFDSGDYPKLLRTAVEAIGLPAVRARQERGETDGRLIGLGISVFSEQTAHGTTADGKRRAFYEQAFARHHARRAARCPGWNSEHRAGSGNDAGADRERMPRHRSVRRARETRRHGNLALFERRLGIARHRLGRRGDRARLQGIGRSRWPRSAPRCCRPDVASVAVRDGGVFGPRGSVSLGDIARAFYLAPADLPGDIDPHGLEVTEGYAPKRLTGVHTGSVHATVVAVDPETGGVEILDYVVVEDAGVLVNPMVVDGQIHGGTAQGIGSALFEEMPFDAQGQPLASTLADYLLPGCPEVPNIRILHMETPSPYTEFGQKGVGRGRRDRTGRGNRQRGERRFAAARRRAVRDTDHAAAHPGGAVAGRAQPPDMLLQPVGAGAADGAYEFGHRRQNCRAGKCRRSSIIVTRRHHSALTTEPSHGKRAL